MRGRPFEAVEAGHILGGQMDTDSSLLRKAKAGDEDSWCRLVEVYGPLVLGWCRQAGVQGGQLDDVTQEVFLTVHRNLADFRRESTGHSFTGWLLTITRSRVADHFRKGKRQPQSPGGTNFYRRLANMSDEELESSISQFIPPDAQLAALDRVIADIRPDFNEKSWAAFWRAIQGSPSPEVAKELGMSANAVRSAKSRILRRIRELLGGLDELLDGVVEE